MQISSSEFTEWQAYYQLEPFGDIIADLRHGVATSTAANANRNKEARSEPFKPQDFIYWGAERQVQQDEEPVLLADPKAQSDLIRAAIFGKPPVT